MHNSTPQNSLPCHGWALWSWFLVLKNKLCLSEPPTLTLFPCPPPPKRTVARRCTEREWRPLSGSTSLAMTSRRTCCVGAWPTSLRSIRRTLRWGRWDAVSQLVFAVEHSRTMARISQFVLFYGSYVSRFDLTCLKLVSLSSYLVSCPQAHLIVFIIGLWNGY